MNRLGSLSPRLAARVQGLDEQGCRSAALAAATFAADMTALHDPMIRMLLDQVASGQVEKTALDAAVQFVERLDEDAWEIQERVDAGEVASDEYIAAFSRARAGSSSTFAANPDPRVAAVEAIYEASFTTEALDDLTDAVGLGRGFGDC